MWRTTVLAAATVAVMAAPALAQEVARSGSADIAIDRRLRRLLEGPYLLIVRDTVIAEGATVDRSVLVLDATLVLEGTIRGDVVAVAAGVFARPTARIEGDLVNAAGGVYRSELASVDGAIVDVPTAPYRVLREPDRFVIEARDETGLVELDGFYGGHMPRYDRVDGLTLEAGATLLPPLIGEVVPELHGELGFRTEREALTGGAELSLRRRGTILKLGGERDTRTNEAWIREPLPNSISFAFARDDYRNYYEADRFWAELGQEFGDLDKSFFLQTSIRGQVENASSLAASDPWTLFDSDDEPRTNPAIDDGRITSLIADFETTLRGRHVVADAGLELEFAQEWIDGLFDFDAYEAWLDLAVRGFAPRHTIRVEGRFMGPLPGTDELPRQRWSVVGGRETLETFPFGVFAGDRVVFIKSRYIVPLPSAVQLPLLGIPDLHLLHSIGAAWTQAADSDFESEVGLRLQTFGPWVRFMFRPDDFHENDLDFGVELEFGGSYPWQR